MTPLMIAIFLFLVHPAVSFTDYCRNHTFDKPNNSENLHFSKENIDRDFGIYDKFKCLHCCCHGYRSIEWFKDGVPYPWPTTVSTLIIRPESGNQTICSLQSTPVDSGRYWCIARNDTHFLKHEVNLQLSGPSISMGWPKTTYRPREQRADRGESVRFFCEAFVGTIDLPDFQSEITWERYDQNRSFVDGKRVLQEAVFREEKRILGSYLYFKEIVPEDYGEYTCKVRNLGDQVLRLSTWLRKKEEVLEYSHRDIGAFWVSFSLIGLLIVIATISTVCLYRLASDRPSRSSGCVNSANKDVLVIYHEYKEKEVSKAVSELQGRHFRSYSVLPLQLSSQLMEEGLKTKANSYGAIMVMPYPSPKNGQWPCECIYQFIQKLLKIHVSIGCTFLQALPTSKPESTEWLPLEDHLSKVYFTDKTNRSESFKCWALRLPKCLLPRKDSFLNGNSRALV